MTIPNEPAQDRKFVRAILPWLVGAAALLVYLLTLNHWVSFSSLPYVSRALGLRWTPELAGSYGPSGAGPFGPFLYLVTYPLRWLPDRWVALALNLFSAICAALTLALLARSVALLPHDRTHEQRLREHSPFSLLSIRFAWIPPVFAAAVCGLQLSFWEHSTAASSAIFDVLLLAYVVRCLLEYRIVQRDSWLLRAALVYGAAMTGDWLMVGLLPAFIAALVWIRGISFFNLRFLRGMFLCGLCGLLLYLLLPLIYALSDNPQVSLWYSFKLNLLAQKGILQLYLQRLPKYLIMLLATTSLLPVLLISIRWASYFGDPSKVGIIATTGILHLMHGALLAVCVWTAFDPVFSPSHRGLSLPALSYLGALSVGYFMGYFLLVFEPLPDRMGRTTASQTALHRLSLFAIWVLLLLIPAGLVCKNLPQVRMTNGPAIGQYTSSLVQNLPEHAVLMSDSQNLRNSNDPIGLWLVQAWLARLGRAGDYLFLDTQSLAAPPYHDFQHRNHPDEWPMVVDAKSKQVVPDRTLINLVLQLSEKNPVYYLHPSFGYYFESFYHQPHGLTFELRAYATNAISRPELTPAEIGENEKFWTEQQLALEALVPFIQQGNAGYSAGFGDMLRHALKIPFEPNATARTLGEFYAHDLDFWGVEVQRSGRQREAGRHFAMALALNPENVAARFNLDFNQDLQAGIKSVIKPAKSFEEEFGKYHDWPAVLRENGPFDDPRHCLVAATVYMQGRLYHQAVQCFERVNQLVPDVLSARFLLARIFSTRFPERALALIADIRTHPSDALTEAGILQSDLSMIEATALYASKKPDEAEKLIRTVLDENPKDERLLSDVARVSSSFGRITNALFAVERELQIRPTNSTALIVKGYFKIQTGKFDEAVSPLTRALALETNNFAIQFPARVDRGIAYLRSGKLDEAKRDYEAAKRMNPASYQVYYGLGEIAWQKNDTNAAIRNYELYLTNAIPDSEEARMISERLGGLKAGPQ